MKLRAASTRIFLGVLLLSLLFSFPSPARALDLPAGHDTSGPLGNGSIGYIQGTTNPTSGMGQQTGAPGSRVTVRGTGFRSFTPVESIEIGGIEVLGNRTINTDENGAFEATDLVVPDLDPGIYSLRIQVGTGDLKTTAVSTFEVTSSSETAGPGATPAQALGPLGARLERAFHFDNATKNWSFYDPRPEFASANTMGGLTEGQVYWLKVTQNTTAVLNGQERVLSCVNEGTPQEDCWNLVVW